MRDVLTVFKEKRISIELEDGVEVKIVYHIYDDIETNTLLAGFSEKRRSLSKMDGYRKVCYAGNSYLISRKNYT